MHIAGFFFLPASLLPNWRFSLSFSLQVRALGASEHSPFSLSDAHIHTHKSDAFIHTHPGAPWLLNCHCSEITALRTRQLDLRAGISCKSPFLFYFFFSFFLLAINQQLTTHFKCRLVESMQCGKQRFPFLLLLCVKFKKL